MRTISSVTVSSGNGSTKKWTVATTAAHGFHVGQTVTISGITTGETRYNASWIVKTVPSATSFTIDYDDAHGQPRQRGYRQRVALDLRPGAGLRWCARAARLPPSRWSAACSQLVRQRREGQRHQCVGAGQRERLPGRRRGDHLHHDRLHLLLLSHHCLPARP